MPCVPSTHAMQPNRAAVVRPRARYPLLTYIIRFQFLDFFFANPYPS